MPAMSVVSQLWQTPVRQDQRTDVAGTADRILPITATADGLPGLIANVRLVRVEGGPHNIGWTHPEEVNKALLEFVDERDNKLAGG